MRNKYNRANTRPYKKTGSYKNTRLMIVICALVILAVWFHSHIPKLHVVTSSGNHTSSFSSAAIDESGNSSRLTGITHSVITADGEQSASVHDKLIDTMLKDMPLSSVVPFPENIPDTSKEDTAKTMPITADDSSPVTPAPALSEEKEETEHTGPSYPIEDVTLSPTTSSGYIAHDNIFIINSTKFKIDPATLLSEPLPFSYDKKKMQVLIVHTHGTESYSPKGAKLYYEDDSTRSLENDKNMIRVGEEMKSILERSGINVVHDTTIHDYPSYNGSYTRALETINAQLEKYPSIQIVLDVHRDAIVDSSNKKYRPVVEYSGERYAQMMLCMGSSEGGLEHKDWQTNLSFAVKLQKKLCDTVPDIMRPIGLKKERYNQHATPGSLIIEVGSDGNSMEEALSSAKIFAQAVADVLKEA